MSEWHGSPRSRSWSTFKFWVFGWHSQQLLFRDFRRARVSPLPRGVLARKRLFSDLLCWDPSGRHPWQMLYATPMLLDAPRGGNVTRDFELLGDEQQAVRVVVAAATHHSHNTSMAHACTRTRLHHLQWLNTRHLHILTPAHRPLQWPKTLHQYSLHPVRHQHQ